MSRAIFVSGATGKQGGALIDSLLQENADFEILALTRDASSASAQKLAKKSPKIKLIQGDLANIDAVFDAAKKVTTLPIWGVYSVQVRDFTILNIHTSTRWTYCDVSSAQPY